jgi:hypothetical protein
MDINPLYDRWRNDRSRVEPTVGFADQVMQRIAEELPADDESTSRRASERSRVVPSARAACCAAAVLAALLRVIELLSMFSATGIEN